jgi:transposase
MTRIYSSYNAADYDVYVGIDVDKKSFAVTFKDQQGAELSRKMPADPVHLENYIKKHCAGQRAICAYEAGPTGYHLYDYLKARRQPCIVTAPITMRKAPNERVKTNRLDSAKLAQELRAGELKTLRVPEGAYRELRQLVKSREEYAAARKSAKQRIKSLLLYSHLETGTGMPESSWSGRYIAALKTLACDESTRLRLNLLLSDLDYARRQTVDVLRGLKRFFRKHAELSAHLGHLQSIPGIGFLTATTLLARIGDPAELRNPRELGCFIGLVPRENSTGDRIVRGHITHMGGQILRSLLVEAAWVAIRGDKELEQFYHRVRIRHHPGIGARKAIVAVARKMTHRIYSVLKERRDYIVH